jgi:raffinose/stachyose/melibiose transport system substrate-binding protein
VDMKKKVAALAAGALAVGLVLAGCSGGSSSGGDAAKDTGKLTILWKVGNIPGLNAVLPAYKKLHPDLKITVTSADNVPLQTAVRNGLSAGTAPDIVWLWSGLGNPDSVAVVGDAGYLEDLSKQPWAGKFPDYINPLTEFGAGAKKVGGGKTGMLPLDITPFGVFYNNESMQKAGLTAPTTWSEVIPFCKAARAAGTVAFAMGPATGDSQNIVYDFAPTLVYGPDPKFDSELASGKTTFSKSEGWQKTLAQELEMQKAGCFQDNLTGTTIPQAVDLAAKGGALSYTGVGFLLGALQASNPSATWSFSQLPATDQADKQYVAASIDGGAGVNAKAKNKQNAIDFLNWLAEPAQMNTYTAAIGGAVPSIANDQFKATPVQDQMQQYITDGHAVTFLNHYWPNASMEDAFQSGLQALLTGDKTPSQVLSDMDTAYKQ